MPFKNIHAARVRNSRNFQRGSFRTRRITRGINAVMGRLKGKTSMTIQSYRFNSKLFNENSARKWLKDHKIKIILFERAI